MAASTAEHERAPLPHQPKGVVYLDSEIATPASNGGGDTPPARAVNAEAAEYYGGQPVHSRARTLSNAGLRSSKPLTMDGEVIPRSRRLSHDEVGSTPRRFLVDVEETMRIVLAQEDTDNNCQISIFDSGPKVISLGTASSNAYRKWDVRGNYMLSNLLQELALARDYGRRFIVLDEARLAENPLDRLLRMIKHSYWNTLTRRMDAQGIEIACNDPKNRSRHNTARLYVPYGETEMLEYYEQIAKERPHLKLKVIQLPKECDDPEYVKSLNEKPGILALAMKKNAEGKLEALPFAVPGARFNEMYNWDSYFMALALLVDGRLDLAKSIVDHYAFQIRHYNKVLNGNRTYYLCRSQPCFVTDLALQVFNQLDRTKPEENKEWLRGAISAAIKEYHRYWMQEPSLDVETGLSRYRPKGSGIPPETEATHFTHILEPYAAKHRMSINDFIENYNDGTLKEPELDDYFQHDRGVRESGHDTSYRLEKKCADLATVDLNSLLYKYEIDIASAIECVFGDEFVLDEEFELSPWPITHENFREGAPRVKSTDKPMKSAEWFERARARKERMDEYLWNEGRGMYFDYNTKKERQTNYECATTLWPLWAGCASEDQALKLVHQGLPKIEVAGGIVGGTEESRGPISLDRPNRQWDFPYLWAPHQIMAWVGLERYGFMTEASRLAYRWLYMVVLTYCEKGGVVVEKYDGVGLSHLVDAEYGNQGVGFKYLSREGFGWTNSSVSIGVQFLTTGMRRAVSNLTSPWEYFDLPVPDEPAIRSREDRAKYEADAERNKERPRRSSGVFTKTFEQAVQDLKSMKM